MNLKNFTLSAAVAVMFGSLALAQGPAPESKDGDRPESPRPEIRDNQPENNKPAKINRERGPKDARPDRDARPMPPREGDEKGEFKPGDKPMAPVPPSDGNKPKPGKKTGSKPKTAKPLPTKDKK